MTMPAHEASQLDLMPSGGQCAGLPCNPEMAPRSGSESLTFVRNVLGALSVAGIAMVLGSGAMASSVVEVTSFGLGQAVELVAPATNPVPGNRRISGETRAVQVPHSSAGPPISTLDRLDHVRREFSLTVSQLASILRVSRLAVYGWLDGRQPRAAHLGRLKALVDLADIWSKASDEPVGNLLTIPLPKGPSLIELLQDQSIDEAAVREALITLSNVRRAKPVPMADAALADGYEVLEEGAVQRSVRITSGRVGRRL